MIALIELVNFSYPKGSVQNPMYNLKFGRTAKKITFSVSLVDEFSICISITLSFLQDNCDSDYVLNYSVPLFIVSYIFLLKAHVKPIFLCLY